MTKLTSSQIKLVLNAVTDLEQSSHNQKKPIIESLKEKTGWSKNKCYQELKKSGYETKRKKRSDAGISVMTEREIQQIAAIINQGWRKNGKQTVTTPAAMQIALSSEKNGKRKLSDSQINRLLAKRHMNSSSLATKKQYQPMRSTHPNHVHGTDPSLCLLYYTPQGRQVVLHDDEIYKNKPEWVEKVGKLKCWRYVLVDHFSGLICVKYYQSTAETSENMWDFLCYAWTKKSNTEFCGVPGMLVWDKGSANQSKSIKNALKSLEINEYSHEAGNPQAKGFVEVANNIVETSFEILLKYEPVSNIDELNEAAKKWQDLYNANLLPHYNSKISRNHIKHIDSRQNLWLKITADQLRLLPDLDTCKYLLIKPPEFKKISRKLTVLYKHARSKKTNSYSVREIPNIAVGQKIKIRSLMYKNLAILIEIDAADGVNTYEIFPEKFDEVGQAISSTIWGDDFSQLPNDKIQKAKNKLEKLAFPGKTEKEIKKAKQKNEVPFDAEFKPITAIKNTDQSIEYIPRRGTVITTNNNKLHIKKPDSQNQPSPVDRSIKKMGAIDSFKFLKLNSNLTNKELQEAFKLLSKPSEKQFTEEYLIRNFIKKPILKIIKQ